jgi:integrase
MLERKKSLPVISILCEEREPKKDGTCPIKIRVFWKRRRKYYSIKASDMEMRLKKNDLHEFIYSGVGDYSMNIDDFNKAMGKDGKINKGKYKRLNALFQELENEAKTYAEKCKPFFTFETFKEYYTDNKTDFENDILNTLRIYIKTLKDEGRIRTSVSYGCTLSSLEGFYSGKNLPFEAITVSFLEKYDKWMREGGKSGKGNSKTTIGINMRQLRAIFNMRPKEMDGLPYPFGEKKYEIPTTKGRKIALENDDLKKIFEYVPAPGTTDEYYLDFWKLQYLMNGINITDLLLLKEKNIENGFIEFERHKTARTKKEMVKIRIPVSHEIKAIFDKYQKKSVADKAFLLPILNGKMTTIEKDKTILYFAQQLTKAMKRISKVLELDSDIQKKISSYSSRHSFASQLMKKGASVAYIQKQLGHTSLETTTNYLSSFEDKDLQEWQGKLTEF